MGSRNKETEDSEANSQVNSREWGWLLLRHFQSRIFLLLLLLVMTNFTGKFRRMKSLHTCSFLGLFFLVFSPNQISKIVVKTTSSCTIATLRYSFIFMSNHTSTLLSYFTITFFIRCRYCWKYTMAKNGQWVWSMAELLWSMSC